MSGSILSPYLYNLYTENLLYRNMHTGTIIADVYTGIIAYADDIILASATVSGLQSMINFCVNYGYQTGIKFNSIKTKFIISGTPPFREVFVRVDDQRVYAQKEITYSRIP